MVQVMVRNMKKIDTLFDENKLKFKQILTHFKILNPTYLTVETQSSWKLWYNMPRVLEFNYIYILTITGRIGESRVWKLHEIIIYLHFPFVYILFFDTACTIWEFLWIF